VNYHKLQANKPAEVLTILTYCFGDVQSQPTSLKPYLLAGEEMRCPYPEGKIMKSVYRFLSQIPFILLATTLLLPIVGCQEPSEKSGDLPETSPEKAGFSSEALTAVSQQAEALGCAALIALYDGQVFYSWGEVNRNYQLHSIRKPMLNSLYGIAVNEGLIDLDATLAELGITDTPTAPTADELQATVRDLLKSRSGIYIPAAAETQEARDTRPARGSHAPDTYFYYNNWDFNVLGTIYEQQTGEQIFAAFERLIAEPIGMQEFDADEGFYRYEPEYSNHPAYIFRMSARDLARFGLLYEHNGRCDGEQIIPTSWITASTTTYSVADTTIGLGYGMLWATVIEGGQASQLVGGVNAFFHTGFGGHLLMVAPELKMVLVQRFDTDIQSIDREDIMMILPMMIFEARIQS
jgi:CubicO group peptidase (beta-lactamase class C family)